MATRRAVVAIVSFFCGDRSVDPDLVRQQEEAEREFLALAAQKAKASAVARFRGDGWRSPCRRSGYFRGRRGKRTGPSEEAEPARPSGHLNARFAHSEPRTHSIRHYAWRGPLSRPCHRGRDTRRGRRQLRPRRPCRCLPSATRLWSSARWEPLRSICALISILQQDR